MRTNALGQILTALQTRIQARTDRLTDELLLSEAQATRRAFSDGVVPAVDVKVNALFGTQAARFIAIEMRQAIAVQLDGIVR